MAHGDQSFGAWKIEPIQPWRDLEAVLAVERESFTNPWTREMFVWELENLDVARIFVLRLANEQVAAFCAVWFIFDELHVNNLAVRPEYRRNGLAGALLTHVMKMAAERGARSAALEVRQSNRVAQRLYERLGFRVAGRRPNYYTNPREDALILRCDNLGGQRLAREPA